MEEKERQNRKTVFSDDENRIRQEMQDLKPGEILNITFAPEGKDGG